MIGIDNKFFANYDNTGPASINYEAITVFSVEEIKKLKLKNQELTNNINLLNTQISDLLNRLVLLENK